MAMAGGEAGDQVGRRQLVGPTTPGSTELVGPTTPTVPAPTSPSVVDDLQRRVERLEARFSVLKRKASQHFETLEKDIEVVYNRQDRLQSELNGKIARIAEAVDPTKKAGFQRPAAKHQAKPTPAI